MLDVAIIGCGVVGAAAAYELSHYPLHVAVLEAENDVADGTTKANSAILHAGYDPEPGTQMARLNVQGVALAKEICARLDVPYRQCGSLVLALSQAELPHLQKLYANGVANGVPGIRLLTAEETLAMEPQLAPTVAGALFAPSAAIVSPWEFALAMAEVAVRNGVELYRSTPVTNIEKIDGGWQLTTPNGSFAARYVVNAAGLNAQAIHEMAAPHTFTLEPTRGEYYLLDKSEGNRVNHVIFQCPNENGKGVLVTPTVHGNLLVGPNAQPVAGDDTACTADGLAFVAAAARRSVPGIRFGESIRNFAGVRANVDTGDFVIGEADGAPGFIDLAGMKSPGLSSAPAVAKEVTKILAAHSDLPEPKTDYKDGRTRVRFKELPPEQKAELIAKNPAYGRVICRCETITEGEILDALQSEIPAVSIDGVKRRCNAGMGRCQGGFCGPRVLELISKTLGIDPLDVLQDKAGTNVLLCETKTGRGATMVELVIIGGGPAGLAAAYSAWQHGLRDILILERDAELGGILNQCIHNGFGLHRFGQQLTGPEYAGRYIEMLRTTGVRVELDTMVLEVTPDKQVHCVSRSKGYQIIQAKSIILCMGCRERTRGAIGTPGTRPAGIYTAGAAQRYVNMEGYLVGRRVLILGSGDIGLIMARRMTLEGAKVLACVEVMPYSGGLTRNIVQCLQDFDIPLYLSHTIVEIQGQKRVEKAIVAKVDENRRPIPGTEMEFDVDTILLSVGLIPENELTRQAGIAMDPHTKGAVVYENMETEIPGVFACGNVVHVHDLVDFVSGESETAGAAAAAYVQNGEIETETVLPLAAGEGIGYTVPQHIRLDGVQKSVSVSFRVRRNYGPSTITVRCGPNKIAAFKRERLAPGEMEHITLPKALLQKADGPLIVAVEEVPQS